MSKSHNVNIWKSLQKVPAGTMFVPLIIGAIITTICQGFFHFDLWETLGNPMKDMFSSSGQMLLIGLMLFCTGTSLKLSDMADALQVSPYYISKLLSSSLNKTFTELVSERRVEASKELLKTNKRIKEIAYEVGFQGQNYFTKVFKNYTGVTPKVYKNTFENKE